MEYRTTFKEQLATIDIFGFRGRYILVPNCYVVLVPFKADLQIVVFGNEFQN